MKGMFNMQKALGSLLAQRQRWEKLMQAAARTRSAAADNSLPSGDLEEIRDFGSNPGALRMFTHMPPQVSGDCALVVVLHGCAQSAAGYDLGAGWSTLADRFGFALLLPEQQRSNNPTGCFNWFQAGDIERGHGEACSIRQMVDTMVSDRGIDPARVFITGLSAGGAMTSVMLATYPEVFAGGAIVAGLPYGAATNVQQAFEIMFQCPPRPARAWGDLVRAASQHDGPWPRVSVWHGGADATVIPSNANEIIKQWTDVHGLPLAPSAQAMVDGYPRQVWVDAAGNEIIESYTITNMAHGTPLATGAADDECGAAGPFLLEVGISSSYHIAKFFGLAGSEPRRVASTRSGITVAAKPPRIGRPAAAHPQPRVLEGQVLEGGALQGEVLDEEAPDPWFDARPGRTHRPPPRVDIGEVITRALKAAGLMKGS
jgi:poly(hydroxyalkanoate) depolymerase family esterase